MTVIDNLSLEENREEIKIEWEIKRLIENYCEMSKENNCLELSKNFIKRWGYNIYSLST